MNPKEKATSVTGWRIVYPELVYFVDGVLNPQSFNQKQLRRNGVRTVEDIPTFEAKIEELDELRELIDNVLELAVNSRSPLAKRAARCAARGDIDGARTAVRRLREPKEIKTAFIATAQIINGVRNDSKANRRAGFELLLTIPR